MIIVVGSTSLAIENSDFKMVEARRTSASTKPFAMYEYLESRFRGATFVDLFARRANLRRGWISLGNEVLGTKKWTLKGRRFARKEENQSKYDKLRET